jgi:hypothetical protein
VEILLAGRVLETFPLITLESVEMTQAESLREWLREVFFNPVEGEVGESREYRLKTGWLLLLIGAAVVTVAAIVFKYVNNHRKQQAERMVIGSGKKKPPNRRIRR